MKPFYFALTVLGVLFSVSFSAQSFTNSSAQLPDVFNSGGCVGVCDMDQDGLDDIIILDAGENVNICYQEVDGSYTQFNYGNISTENQWGMTIGDLDEDGHNDIYSGASYDGSQVLSISARGVSSGTVDLPNGNIFMQGCNMADINNDGSLDIFACHDDGLSRVWENDGAGNMTNTTSLIDLLNYDYSAYPTTDHSGNYGSVWTDVDMDGDIDLFIAKCRQSVSDPLDPRRINQLWINDGAGNFTEEAAVRGLVLNQQSWTSDFADIDNDGDFDCLITNHSTTLTLYENDGNGFFTDITAGSGLEVTGFFLQAKMADMDNDGYVDLIYSGGTHAYLHNNGDQTFSAVPNTFPYSDTMHSLGIGDLNNDGALDVYASYGNSYVSTDNNNPDILWLNDGNSNNYVSFALEGSLSNLNAVGAKVKIYGPWGVQVREIRAGESYGIVTSFHCHFGIGSNTSIDSAVIEWPSGLQTVLTSPAINTVHSIFESSCQISGVTITANGSTSLCPGENITLDGPAGYSTYLWSNGETTESIAAAAEGNYSLTVLDVNGCAGVSNAIAVNIVTPEAPSVEASGELSFCEGSSVSLTASEGTSFLWSTGDITQSILVSATGVYTVNVVDQCASALSSEAIQVEVFPYVLPEVGDEVLLAAGAATLSGTTATLNWYDDPLAVTPVATGMSYTTPFLNSTTSYWVEDVTTYGGVQGSGGELANLTDGVYHTNSDNWLIFDAHEDFYLKSITLNANGAGNREILVVDASGTMIASGTFSIPNGESVVDLNFFVPAGTDYGLKCTDANPQLWRNAPPTALSYPYNVGTLATITTSTVAGANALNYYYFFYNWEVETASFECVSDRIEVQVIVQSGVEGCTDPTACNYNSDANTDDGSCFYNCVACFADFNSNGTVGTDDLLVLLANINCAAPEPCQGDLNGDGVVSVADLLTFLSAYGLVCDQ
jgi:hypothetical protein